MNQTRDSILIFAPGTNGQEPPSEVRRGIGSLVAPAINRASEVAVDTLKSNIQAFLRQLDDVLSAAPPNVGGMEIDQVEFHAQVDSQGNVGIASFIGAQLTVQGGISFVLRKRRE
jgi:hypothetical protein